MVETKQEDPLEASFAGAEDIAALKAGMADLKAKLDGATVAAARVPLDGARPRPTSSAPSSSAICATATPPASR